jgi:hypothetical protein
LLSRGGEGGGWSGLRKSAIRPLPVERETLVNSDFFICEKFWGKMTKEEDLKSNVDGRGDENNEDNRGKN